MWDRPRPVSAASVGFLLAVLVAGIPAPTRGACEGDNATAVALCNSLVGTVLNSPFNATRIAYVCDPEVLYSDYRCLAMGMNHTIHARPHLMETRDVAPDGRRHVVDERGKPKRLPMPFRNGDKLAKAGHPVESSERNYVLAFEMFGVMRNAMFFRGPWITDDDWRRWHGPLTDCGLDDDDVFETAKNHPDGKLGRQLNRTMVLRMIRYPMYNGGDTAAQMEHYADAALADFLCVVAPELSTDPTYASWPHRSRCVAIRQSLALATNKAPTCWLNAYRRFYTDQGPAHDASSDVGAQGGSHGSGYWDEHAKLAGRGYQPTEREREIMAKARREADVASGSEGGAPGDRSNEIPGMTDGVSTDANDDTSNETPPPDDATTKTKTGAKNQDGVEAVPGEPLSDQVIASAPGWPTRLLYVAWRQQPGVGGGDALMAGLVKHCGEVKAAADEWGLGGSCDVTTEGAITGTAEGSAYNVAEFTKWIIKSFHAHEFGDSPTLLGPDVSQLDTEFSAPESPEDYPEGYLEGDEESPDDAPPASNEGAKHEL